MGFGIMFIGYLIAFAGSLVPQISFLAYILGSGIILFSLRKLIFENKLFIVSAVFVFLLEVSSIISLGIELFDTSNKVSTVFGYIAVGSAFMLNFFLMLAIYILANDVGVLKVKIFSIISMVLVEADVVFYVLGQVISSKFALDRLLIFHYIFLFAYIILSSVTIFNSYMRICYEGDENMQRETSGIPLFDALNKLFEKVFNKKNNKGK